MPHFSSAIKVWEKHATYLCDSQPRAVCNRMEQEGLASASYVGNLSYGWTGNLGQPMPDNWAID